MVETARANYDSTELQVRLEVEQAYIAVVEAAERYGATQKAVESAQENLRLAQGRYDAGVGTGSALDRIKGGVFGAGLSQNVLDGYRFIADNYDGGGGNREPDDIFLVGFSRGAFTARSLAGMLGAVGLLEKRDMNRVPEAFDIYRTKPQDRPGHPSSGLVERTRKVTIKFIGVWDTVGQLGIPRVLPVSVGLNRQYEFHDTALSRAVSFARHAVAICGIGRDRIRRHRHTDVRGRDTRGGHPGIAFTFGCANIRLSAPKRAGKHRGAAL